MYPKLLVFMDDPLLIPCSVFSNVFYDTLLVLVLCPSLVPFEQSIGIDWISCCYMWQLTAFRRISFPFVSFRCVSFLFPFSLYRDSRKIALQVPI